MTKVTMTVNGKAQTRDVPDTTLLSDFLREELRLTGTHVGCDTSQCGACVVHVDGRAVKACTALAVALDGAEVTTIEGVAQGKDLHPMQIAFNDHHGLQCGFCTPGMIMTGIDMVERYKASGLPLTEEAIRHELEGNICRCTGYHNIVRAIEDAAQKMQAAPAAAAE
jgi:carbon-monoxide dehydrogenase small subunit